MCSARRFDIRSFFDTLDKKHLLGLLDQRVRDGVIRRTVDKTDTETGSIYSLWGPGWTRTVPSTRRPRGPDGRAGLKDDGGLGCPVVCLQRPREIETG